MANVIDKSMTPGRVPPSLAFAQLAWNGADKILFIGGVDGTPYALPFSVAGILKSAGLTGTPTTPDPPAGDNTTQVANTGWVQRLAALLAPLASPSFTGTPKAPTVGAGDASTSISTTFYADRSASQAASAAAAKLTAGNVVQGRLTTVSGVGVPTSDVAAATTMFYTGSVTVPLYNGTSWLAYQVGELSLNLDPTSSDSQYHASTGIYDFFVFLLAGVPTLGTGPAWASNTSRGTGAGTTELQLVNGIWTNKNQITLRYGGGSSTAVVPANQATAVGCARMIAPGTTCDTARQRFVYNFYNGVERPLKVSDPANNWTYSTASYRQANGSSGNQVEFLLGLGGVTVNCRALGVARNSTATATGVQTGIGLDATNVNNATLFCFSNNVGSPAPMSAEYKDAPGLGYHFLAWLEYGGGTSDTQTWFGINSGAQTLLRSGMSGGLVA